MTDTTKSRWFGFHEWVETEEMLMRLFSQFQKMRFIPSQMPLIFISLLLTVSAHRASPMAPKSYA